MFQPELFKQHIFEAPAEIIYYELAESSRIDNFEFTVSFFERVPYFSKQEYAKLLTVLLKRLAGHNDLTARNCTFYFFFSPSNMFPVSDLTVTSLVFAEP